MKCDELKRHRPDIMVLGEGKALAVMADDPMGVWCHIQDVRDILDEKDKEIAELKQKLENVQASVYCDVVDAGMENRKLKRALWLARAERAKTEHLSKIMYSTLYRDFIAKWVNVERKCRAKAEEYK